MFHYFGGKSRVARRILRYVPPHKTWVEPFAGGASLTFAKPPSENEVISDKRPDLIRFYKHVQQGKPLKCGCSGNKCINASHRVSPENRTPCDFLASVQASWGGKAEDTPQGSWGRPLVTKPVIRNYDCYHNRLKNTTILESDYQPVMRAYDSPSTVFYVDAPYPQTKKDYTDYTTGVPNPQELRDFLAKRKGCVIMSYPNIPEARRMFGRPPFHYRRLKVRNSFYGPLRKQGAPSARPFRIELLVMNKRCRRM